MIKRSIYKNELESTWPASDSVSKETIVHVVCVRKRVPDDKLGDFVPDDELGDFVPDDELGDFVPDDELGGLLQTRSWEAWIRSTEVMQQRECIIPDVPRTSLFGNSVGSEQLRADGEFFKKPAFNTLPSVRLKAVDR